MFYGFVSFTGHNPLLVTKTTFPPCGKSCMKFAILLSGRRDTNPQLTAWKAVLQPITPHPRGLLLCEWSGRDSNPPRRELPYLHPFRRARRCGNDPRKSKTEQCAVRSSNTLPDWY